MMDPASKSTPVNRREKMPLVIIVFYAFDIISMPWIGKLMESSDMRSKRMRTSHMKHLKSKSQSVKTTTNNF